MVQCLLVHCLLIHCLRVHRLCTYLLAHGLLRTGAWLLQLWMNNPLLRMGVRLDWRLSKRLAGANYLAHRWRIGLICLPLVLTRALRRLVRREGRWLLWSYYALRSPKPVTRRVLNWSGR